MECTGRLKDASRSLDGKAQITLAINEVGVALAGYDSLKDAETLDIVIKKHRKKRSLNANNYFHNLVGQIADVLNSSHTEVHNRLISEYGQIDTDVETIIMRDDVPWLKLENMHLRPTTATQVLDNKKLYRVYFVMRGSHTYDTAEMSKLIDGTVSEAKELGIETMTPNELERMKQLWKA
ncbi:MAG: hypothetical protein NC225_12730 [Clostridium sp.]|nr:hypothetical protein [Clostridium sp.]MCM1459697.1 hypothetical protein [Bacteroides sp.]